MRRIDKDVEPQVLVRWRRSSGELRYPDLSPEERRAIRSACLAEQYGLCAYCCQSITLDDSHNEHVEAQDRAPNRTLDFSNIVASCQQPDQCGRGRGPRPLALTPLMEECETELKFYLSGLVEGRTERAKACVETLNLGHTDESNRGLVGARKTLVDALIYAQGSQPGELLYEDEEILGMILEDLQTPNAEQRLQPFSPVLVNVIRQLLTQP
ncbi:retron system putative HNH endonuclease [Pseudomonas sp.]|uniref:retron system putative HNH endonuclease n=1 Tax=Pseudomonas sp. TaxID=306 RepID=UPI003F985F33